MPFRRWGNTHRGLQTPWSPLQSGQCSQQVRDLVNEVHFSIPILKSNVHYSLKRA